MSPSEPPKEKKRGFFWWIGLIVIVLVILAILGALRKNQQTQNATNTSSTSSSSTTQNTETSSGSTNLSGLYKNVVGGYKIHYPNGWVIDSAAVALVGVSLKESDNDDAAAVDVYAIPNNDDISLEQAKKTYTSGSALLGTSNILTFRVKSEKQTTFKDKAAYEVVTTFQSKATNATIQGKMVIFQSGGRNYALYAHSTKSSFSQNVSQFDSIINSFTFL